MKYRVNIEDKQMDIKFESIIAVRKRTSLVTVALKGLEKHLENNLDSENEETLKLVNGIKRKCNNDLETFLEDIRSELDFSIVIIDLNNHIYEHRDTGERKTSFEVGKYSYYQAWQSQFNNEDGVKSFLDYLPNADILVEHGNEMMMKSIAKENEDWEIVEEEE